MQEPLTPEPALVRPARAGGAVQDALVPLLKKKFPRLQVVATTHSPLIAGNLERGEMIRLRRDQSGKIEVLPLDEEIQGWRADQILTNPAFGLASTRKLVGANFVMTEGSHLYPMEHPARAAQLTHEMIQRLLAQGTGPNAI